MRGGREIGQRHRIARQPAAVVQQPGHVIEVKLDLLRTGLDVLALGIALLHQLLVDAFAQKVGRDFTVELVVEPADQSADLCAFVGGRGHQARGRVHFLDPFADRGAFSHETPVDLQHRHLARRVAPQEVGVAVPVTLFDQLTLDPLFGQ